MRKKSTQKMPKWGRESAHRRDEATWPSSFFKCDRTKAEKRRRGARAPKDEWEEEGQGKHFIHPNSRSPAPAENTGNPLWQYQILGGPIPDFDSIFLGGDPGESFGVTTRFRPQKGAQPRKIAYLKDGSADARILARFAEFGNDAGSRTDLAFTRAAQG